MRREEPEACGAICPLCAHKDAGPTGLALADVFEDSDGDVRFGMLRCVHEACQGEFPIIDGVPVVRADARDALASGQHALRRREDLPPEMERVLADTVEPGSSEDIDRYYLSVYARDAYPADGGVPGVVRLMDEALGLIPGGLDVGKSVLELGCAVGRCCFELAARGHERVVGLDANLTMLRCASGVRAHAEAIYTAKRSGVLYDPVRVPVGLEGRARVSLWCGDALAPAFAEGSFDCVLALNVLDCVASPVQLLERAAAMLRPGGRLVLTSPYDWSTSATALGAWVGGHSPRSDLGGDSAGVLRSLLTPGSGGQTIEGLRLVAERDGLEWATRLHERAELRYRVHAVVAERV